MAYDWVEVDRASYGTEPKERLSPSSLIKLEGKNFFNMTSAEDLSFIEASAPAWHTRMLHALKASGKIREDQVMAPDPSNRGYVRNMQATRHEKKFTRGTLCKVKDDGERPGKKVTIIHASAGHTKKTHTPVHLVADRNGDTWLERETNLKLIV